MYSLDDDKKAEEQESKDDGKKETSKRKRKSLEMDTIISLDSEEEGEIIELSDGEEEPKHRSRPSTTKRTRPGKSSSHVIESKPFLHKDQVRQSQEVETDLNYDDDDDDDHYHYRHQDYHEYSGRNGGDSGSTVSRSKLNKIPPVRLIVQDADQLDIGSLVLVSCLGGKFGQHSSCAVTIPDVSVSQVCSTFECLI